MPVVRQCFDFAGLALVGVSRVAELGPVVLAARRRVTAGSIDDDLPFRWQIGGAGLRIGHDAGLPVCDDYEIPFTFDGTIVDVVFEQPMFAPRTSAPPSEEIGAALHRE